MAENVKPTRTSEQALLGGGCFWCLTARKTQILLR
jgi:peptide methionine sulfoxide reductase MsrA